MASPKDNVVLTSNRSSFEITKVFMMFYRKLRETYSDIEADGEFDGFH